MRSIGRSLLVGLLVGLVACHDVGPKIRMGAQRAKITVHALDAPDEQVEVAPAAFRESVAVSARRIDPVARPLEHARQLMEYPGLTALRLRIVLASWPSDSLTREYGAWCAGARGTPGDCLSLLEGPSLNEDGRASLALTFAFGTVLDETASALKQTVSPQAVLSMLVSSIAMYLMLWVLPEPVTKGLAAVLTAGLMAYLGVGTVWRMISGWRQLVKESEAATSLGELRDAGERFGKIIGQNAAQVFVMLASAALASTLGTALQSGSLPGAAQAATIGANQGGFRLAAASGIQSVAVAAQGEFTIVLAPVAVAMAPARPPSGTTRPPPLKQYDIDRMGRFNIPCRTGDGLCGHEMLQFAWIRAHGYAAQRYMSAAQRNPAIALDPKTHHRVGNEQIRLGLHDDKRLAVMSAEENIRLNAQAMRAAGIPEHVIREFAKEVTAYAASLAR